MQITNKEMPLELELVNKKNKLDKDMLNYNPKSALRTKIMNKYLSKFTDKQKMIVHVNALLMGLKMKTNVKDMDIHQKIALQLKIMLAIGDQKKILNVKFMKCKNQKNL